MRAVSGWAVAISLLVFAEEGNAQEQPPPPPSPRQPPGAPPPPPGQGYQSEWGQPGAPEYRPPPPPPPSPRGGPAEARRGFQMHIVPLAAVTFPLGNTTGANGDQLASRYSTQWMPLDVGLGAKLSDTLYLGGYLNFTVGFAGDDPEVEQQCVDDDSDLNNEVECSSDSVRAGLELRYTFEPAERTTGWVGYGLGWTTASQKISDNVGYSERVTVTGVELGRLSAGFDWRATKGFGMGPLVMASVGRYLSTQTQIGADVTDERSIEDQAMHVWLTLALRLVIFP